jgi:hypothetical protein
MHRARHELGAEPGEPDPAWVQHVVNWGGTIWSYHPIQAGVAPVTVWRLAGAATAWSKIQTIDVPLQYGSSS